MPYKDPNYQKKYQELHKEELSKKKKVYMKEYYKNHRKEIAIRRKSYQEEYKNTHKKEAKEYRKIWSNNHKDYFKKYIRNRLKIDINFRIKHYLRTRLNDTLKRKKHYKFNKTTELLGCSIDFLKNYLQSLFQSNMTWNNYGKWHIDHIRPCCTFDLSKRSEQYKCFHYKNLQPLWAEDNLRKIRR